MQDDQLIFMISLPRSGSTLLQKILGGHDEIYTRSEPWLMLHSLYALKHEGIDARYGAHIASQAVQHFIADLPGDGEDLYYTQLRECHLPLYAAYLQGSGKSRFLDKTPRYYEVFDELQKTFPRAKFIILYRNPLAVLASILDTWVKGNLDKLKGYKGDLCKGTEFLQRDFSAYSNTHIVRYEDLLQDPESVTATLFAFLQLPNQPECIDYGKQPAERWKYGDPSTVYANSRPDAQHADIWQRQLSITENRKLLADYLRMLGKPGFERMGYDYTGAQKAISESELTDQPPQQWPSLQQLLRSSDEENKRLQAESTNLQVANTNLQAENTNLQAANTNLQAENTNLQAENTNLQAENTNLQAENTNLQVANTNLQAENTNLQVANTNLQAENTNLEYQLTEHTQSLKRQAGLIDALDMHLANILQSAESLKAHRALLKPWRKLRAYKQMLVSINVAHWFQSSRPANDKNMKVNDR